MYRSRITTVISQLTFGFWYFTPDRGNTIDRACDRGFVLHHILMFLFCQGAWVGDCNLTWPGKHNVMIYDDMIYGKTYFLGQWQDHWNTIFFFDFLQTDWFSSEYIYYHFLKTVHLTSSLPQNKSNSAQQWTLNVNMKHNPVAQHVFCTKTYISGQIHVPTSPTSHMNNNKKPSQSWVGRHSWHLCVSGPISWTFILFTQGGFPQLF